MNENESGNLQIRIAYYQASRDYAISILAKALGIEADTLRAVEYYARLAADLIVDLQPDAERWRECLRTGFPVRNQTPHSPAFTWLARDGNVHGETATAAIDAARQAAPSGQEPTR